MKKEYIIAIQGAVTAVVAYLSDRMGVLFPVMCLLVFSMVADYFSGMMASKREALDHPGDSNYGWSSKKGAKGIIKKVSYLCVIAVAMIVDYVIAVAAGYLDITMPVTAFFGLLVTLWYVLNELLSIIENAGRMGGPVPEWLRKYIAVLKDKIDSEYDAGDKGT